MEYNYRLLLFSRTENFGNRDHKSVLMVLKNKQAAYIALVTPIMRCAYNMGFSQNIVFVDSSDSCDQTNTVVTFMFGVSNLVSRVWCVTVSKALPRSTKFPCNVHPHQSSGRHDLSSKQQRPQCYSSL